MLKLFKKKVGTILLINEYTFVLNSLTWHYTTTCQVLCLPNAHTDIPNLFSVLKCSYFSSDPMKTISIFIRINMKMIEIYSM